MEAQTRPIREVTEAKTIQLHTNPAEVQDVRPRRRRWTPEEKEVLTLRAVELREAGERWADVARKLNVLEGSLRKWVEDYYANQHLSAGEAPLIETSTTGISVVTPDGYRVEGLDLDSAHVLLVLLRGE